MIVDHITVRETLNLADADASLHITSDGYLVARPRVARTGIQIYAGAEVGKPHMDRVRVYRPEEEVFNKDAMASLAHRPITNNHPPEAVTADNWKKYSAGQVGDEVARDGEFIRVPLVVMDGNCIRDIKNGKKEISLGYGANLEWRSGVTDKGEAYDAVQTGIRVNHLAIVDAARGGAKLVIGDDASAGGRKKKLDATTITEAIKRIRAGHVDQDTPYTAEIAATHAGERLNLATEDSWFRYPIGTKDGKVFRQGVLSAKAVATRQGDVAIVSAADALLEILQPPQRKDRSMNDTTRKLTVDGIAIEVSEMAAQVIQRMVDTNTTAQTTLKTQLDAASTKVVALESSVAKLTEDHGKVVAGKDAEIATLKQQVKDSEITPAKLDALVKDRAVVIAKGQALIGNALVVDGKTVGELRKQVVLAKMGDTAKEYTDDQVKISFDTLTAGVEIRADGTGTANNAGTRIADAFSYAPNGGFNGVRQNDASNKELENYNKDLENAWKAPAGQA
jgi:hypothetical protein